MTLKKGIDLSKYNKNSQVSLEENGRGKEKNSGGRPTKSEEEKRKKKAVVYFSEEEFELLQAHAKRTRRSISAFLSENFLKDLDKSVMEV